MFLFTNVCDRSVKLDIVSSSFPLFLRIICGSLPSYSVIRHPTFQSRRFQVSIHSIHPSILVFCLPLLIPTFSASIICLQAWCSDRILTCPNHSQSSFCYIGRYISHPTALRMYSFLMLPFPVYSYYKSSPCIMSVNAVFWRSFL